MPPSEDWCPLCSGFNLLNRGTIEMGRTCMIHWGILAFSHRFSGPGSLFVSALLRYCFCSATQSCPSLCDPMDCSTPGFTVLHQLPEFAQTHVHWISDAIQPSHPVSPPSPPALSLPLHQGLCHWVSFSHQVAKVLELQLQLQSFQWIFRADSFRIDWSDLLAVQGILKSLLQHHNLKASILQNSAFSMVQLPHPNFDYMDLCQQNYVPAF